MNAVQIADNQRAILLSGDGRRFYILYRGDIAYTYVEGWGGLSNIFWHIPTPGEAPCMFLNGIGCRSDGRTIGTIHGEEEIFNFMLEEMEGDEEIFKAYLPL